MFYDKFKELCTARHVSVSKAATDIGLSNSTPTKWKNTNATPDSTTLTKIADYFGVSVDYLLGGGQKENAPTPEGERDLVDAVIFGRDGKRIKRTYSKEQMETVYKLLDAIPHKDEDI